LVALGPGLIKKNKVDLTVHLHTYFTNSSYLCEQSFILSY
jgi:hypothetical protein